MISVPVLSLVLNLFVILLGLGNISYWPGSKYEGYDSIFDSSRFIVILISILIMVFILCISFIIVKNKEEKTYDYIVLLLFTFIIYIGLLVGSVFQLLTDDSSFYKLTTLGNFVVGFEFILIIISFIYCIFLGYLINNKININSATLKNKIELPDDGNIELKLVKLKALLEKDLISKEEYEIKKEELLKSFI